MTDVRAEEAAPYRGSSILIHGTGETAMAVLVSALAREEVGTFGWVECASSPQPPEPAARRVLEESAESASEPEVRPEDLLPPPNHPRNIATWLVRDPFAAEATARLAAYLRLPLLLQRVVSRVTTVNARAVVVLTNVDALAGPALERALGSVEVHETLHREGVSLLVTFRGEPSNLLRAPFDRVYRVEGRPDQVWQEARVTTERGDPVNGFPPGETLGQRLPWLGLSGSPTEGDAPIRGHRLR